MTRIPTESWNIKPRLDLSPYELNKACPLTGEITGLEDHHIFRRSFTALGKEDNDRLFWVEIEDGMIIGNRINLSSQAHYRLTVNKARIMFAEGVWYWVENGQWDELRWQPPVYTGVTDLPQNFETDNDPVTYKQLAAVVKPQPGDTCAFCKRRVPHPKKATSPITKVFSCRVPIDDAETFSELVDAAAEHMGAKAKPHHVYWTLLTGLTLLLQAPKEQLP